MLNIATIYKKMSNINLKHNYLTNYIITYLGNKRKLIPFIDSVVDNIIQNDCKLKDKQTPILFFDIFAGSGVVSRYSKLKGFCTYSNDLEKYAYAINSAVTKINKNNINELFRPVCEYFSKTHPTMLLIENDSYYIQFINFLNTLNKPENPNSIYFSANYAPKNTEKPDFYTERLFYTQENALKLDAFAEIVHDNFFEHHTLAKHAIMTSIFYHMLWNINTSGTMKGFHHGWGGKGGDALARILSPIQINPFPFIDGNSGEVYCNDATTIFNNLNLPTMDIIYADPPYNQHQYSANYHLLNTFYLNDKYAPGEVVLGSRAGIRVDHNRSAYSKRQEATKAFNLFINNIKTKYLIVSYNNEGIINIEDMIKILSKELTNKITIEQKTHDKFKGGKSTQSSNKVVEYLIVTQYNQHQSQSELNLELDKIKIKTSDNSILDNYYDPKHIQSFIAHSTISKTTNGYNLENEKDIVCQFDQSLKIKTYNKDVLSEELIKNLIPISKTDLIKFYIEYDNLDLAIKNLKYLKIKKYTDSFNFYAVSIFNSLTHRKNQEKLIEKLNKTLLQARGKPLDDFIKSVQ